MKNRTREQLEALVGKKFGRWTVVRYVRVSGSAHIYEARCECGTIKQVQEFNLLKGKSSQCKHCADEAKKKRFGQDTKYYRVWNRVREIGCVDEWLDIAKFWEDVGTTIPAHQTLVKIDESSPFGPDNYRWGIPQYKTSARRYSFDGKNQTVREIQTKLSVSRQRVHQILLLAAGRCLRCGEKRDREDRQLCYLCREKLRKSKCPKRRNKSHDWNKIVEEVRSVIGADK